MFDLFRFRLRASGGICNLSNQHIQLQNFHAGRHLNILYQILPEQTVRCSASSVIPAGQSMHQGNSLHTGFPVRMALVMLRHTGGQMSNDTLHNRQRNAAHSRVITEAVTQ